MLSGPVRWLGMSLSMAQRAVASGNRLFEILDREPSMQSPALRSPASGRAAARSSCETWALSYNGGEPSLSGIDLEVEPGRTVALVGPTASGKTSLVGLLARLYDPTEGSVRIDGTDIREVDLGLAALSRSRSWRTTASSSRTPSPATSPTRTPMRPQSRLSSPHAEPRRRIHRSGRPTGTRRPSVSEG